MYSGGLTYPEVENMVEHLEIVPVDKVGSSAWKKQRHVIEQLNVVAHGCAAEKKDNVVLNAMVSFEKLPILIHDLLVMEAWRHKVLPNVNRELQKHPAGNYMYAMYEGVIINLLETLMYHEECVTGFGDDILELIDYCWRNVASNLIADETINNVMELEAKALMSMSEEERFKLQMRESSIHRSLSCVALLWFTIERANNLPLSVTNSLLVKNDVLIGFAQLIEKQPWMRRDSKIVQKYVGGKFVEVSRQDAFRVVPHEANAWFAIHYMLCDRTMRQKYQYTKHKKDLITTLSRFLNETLVDQIPPLADVQRAVEELKFMDPPTGTEEKFKSSLVIEQMPRITASIEGNGRDWTAIAKEFMANVLSPQSMREDAERMSKLFDMMNLDGEK